MKTDLDQGVLFGVKVKNLDDIIKADYLYYNEIYSTRHEASMKALELGGVVVQLAIEEVLDD